MKTIEISDFFDLDEAMIWLEDRLVDYALEYEDVKGEISLIDGSWRVGVITGSRQMEFDID